MKNFLKVYGETGLNQKDFADLVNISANYLRKIERGEANPSLSMLKEFADKLNISIIDFFTTDQFEKSKYYTVIEKGSGDHLLNSEVIEENERLKKELNEQRAKSLSLYERMDDLIDEGKRLADEIESLKDGRFN